MIEEAIRDFLLDDLVLTGILTGGIVTFDETGRNGIGVESTPTLFDGAYLKPCAMVKLRSMSARNDLRDVGENIQAASGVVEIWFYDDGDNGYEDILDAQGVVYSILPRQRISGAGWLRWTNDIQNIRDSSLEGASALRSDYRLVNIKG
jgi:hypothetical protein